VEKHPEEPEKVLEAIIVKIKKKLPALIIPLI